LAIIGLFHLLFLWAGDILLLYALIGFTLPLFRKVQDKKLLLLSVLLFIFPVLIDAFKILTDYRFSLVIPVNKANEFFNAKYGITDDNFGIWLLEGKNYIDILKFNIPGSFIRCREFIEGNRIVKVLGLFLLGLYIGRNRIYARLDDYRTLLKKARKYGFIFGLPFSCLFAWSEMNQRPWGLIVNSVFYALSVVPLSLAYISSLCIWYVNKKDRKIHKIIAAPGKMALTNYIGQSLTGIIIFYGIGFQLALLGLIQVEMIAFGVFIFQILFCCLWLKYFRFGPLEWVWRMLTYKKWLKINK
jgi:uncharacterized protein